MGVIPGETPPPTTVTPVINPTVTVSGSSAPSQLSVVVTPGAQVNVTKTPPPVVNVSTDLAAAGGEGPSGASIVSMAFVNGELIVTLSNGAEINAGYIEGQAGDGGLTQQQVEGIAASILLNHTEDDTPHPTYDDLPDLRLIFENGLV